MESPSHQRKILEWALIIAYAVINYFVSVSHSLKIQEVMLIVLILWILSERGWLKLEKEDNTHTPSNPISMPQSIIYVVLLVWGAYEVSKKWL